MIILHICLFEAWQALGKPSYLKFLPKFRQKGELSGNEIREPEMRM